MEEDEVRIREAVAQFVGFIHHRNKFSLYELVDSMGLTKEEWISIKKDYVSDLSVEDINSVDIYFDNKKTVMDND